MLALGILSLPVVANLLFPGSRAMTPRYRAEARVEVRLSPNTSFDWEAGPDSLSPDELERLLREEPFRSQSATLLKTEDGEGESVRAGLLPSTFDDGNSKIFKITARSSQKPRALELVRLYCEEMDKFIHQKSLTTLKARRIAAEQLSDQAEGKSLAAETELQSFKEAKLYATFTREKLQTIASLEGQIQKLEQEAKALDSALDRTRGILYSHSAETLEQGLKVKSPDLDALRQKVKDKREQLSQAQLLNPEKAPAAQEELDKAVDSYRKALTDVAQTQYQTTSQERLRLMQEKAKLDSQLRTLLGQSLSLKEKLELHKREHLAGLNATALLQAENNAWKCRLEEQALSLVIGAKLLEEPQLSQYP